MRGGNEEEWFSEGPQVHVTSSAFSVSSTQLSEKIGFDCLARVKLYNCAEYEEMSSGKAMLWHWLQGVRFLERHVTWTRAVTYQSLLFQLHEDSSSPP